MRAALNTYVADLYCWQQ